MKGLKQTQTFEFIYIHLISDKLKLKYMKDMQSENINLVVLYIFDTICKSGSITPT